MTGVLGAIVAGARRSAVERMKRDGASVERRAAAAQPRGADFSASLAADGVRIIAECKRRSPSRGILKRAYDAAAIARAYERAGAAAISVLTEPAFFDGALDDLRAVRAAVRLPLLRKDFIVSEFQIVEARAAGADAVLLIVAALTDAELSASIHQAAALGMAALVEAHTIEEAMRAADSGATIIGVNSRNLRTLEVSLSVFDAVAAALPTGCCKVAESGIRNPADVRRLQGLGYQAFLIGERFMTEEDPGVALASFLEGCEMQERQA